MQKAKRPSYIDFLACFPTVDLPLHLTEETLHIFSRENKPLPQAIIDHFLADTQTEGDAWTEYVACARVVDSPEFDAVIYWKGSLLVREFILATYRKNGQRITEKVVAGMRSDGRTVTQSVATFDEDWIVTIMVGQTDADSRTYDPDKSRAMSMEILATGDIIFSLQD